MLWNPQIVGPFTTWPFFQLVVFDSIAASLHFQNLMNSKPLTENCKDSLRNVSNKSESDYRYSSSQEDNREERNTYAGLRQADHFLGIL